jgi:hypothetical protein
VRQRDVRDVFVDPTYTHGDAPDRRVSVIPKRQSLKYSKQSTEVQAIRADGT